MVFPFPVTNGEDDEKDHYSEFIGYQISNAFEI